MRCMWGQGVHVLLTCERSVVQNARDLESIAGEAGLLDPRTPLDGRMVVVSWAESPVEGVAV